MSKKLEDVFEGQDLDVSSSEVDFALVLDLEGFEGPIDVLLTLAREQKLDPGLIFRWWLWRISI